MTQYSLQIPRTGTACCHEDTTINSGYLMITVGFAAQCFIHQWSHTKRPHKREGSIKIRASYC